MKTEHFKHLCIIARETLKANVSAPWSDVAELIKTRAARAGLDYDGASVGEAMERVKASTKYKGPATLPHQRVSRSVVVVDPPRAAAAPGHTAAPLPPSAGVIPPPAGGGFIRLGDLIGAIKLHEKQRVT